MGGPCKIVGEQNSFGVRLKKDAPSCTDNFQIAVFDFAGCAGAKNHTFYSCEHAYQAAKFLPNTRSWTSIATLSPRQNESGKAFGMRCWQAGQIHQPRADWSDIKVCVMYKVNLAKYLSHEELRKDLISTSGQKLIGAPSTCWTLPDGGETHQWSVWNAIVQMRIREELILLKEGACDNQLLENLKSMFDSYYSIRVRL